MYKNGFEAIIYGTIGAIMAFGAVTYFDKKAKAKVAAAVNAESTEKQAK